MNLLSILETLKKFIPGFENLIEGLLLPAVKNAAKVAANAFIYIVNLVESTGGTLLGKISPTVQLLFFAFWAEFECQVAKGLAKSGCSEGTCEAVKAEVSEAVSNLKEANMEKVENLLKSLGG